MFYTIWDGIIQTIFDTAWVPFVLSFILIFARVTITAGKNIGYQFEIHSELGQSLDRII